MIEVSGLSFSYGKATSLAFPSFSVAKGGQLLLLGESGSGKTTLLHILGGLLRNYTGHVVIDGTDLAQLSESALDQFRGQHIGFIFQKNHLISALTVEQNLMLAPYLAGLGPALHRIDSLLEILGLSDKKKSRVNELSQGQAQRVAIARAVLNRPAILFADEPTSALDDKNCAKVSNLLINVAVESNSTLIVATHDQRLKDKIANSMELKSVISK